MGVALCQKGPGCSGWGPAPPCPPWPLSPGHLSPAMHTLGHSRSSENPRQSHPAGNPNSTASTPTLPGVRAWRWQCRVPEGLPATPSPTWAW